MSTPTWQHSIERMATLIERLNAALGYDGDHKVTFGYLGNCNGTPGTPAWMDDRAWCVFLPHPGRVGTVDDRIGHVHTDDAAGLHHLVAHVAHLVHFTTWRNRNEAIVKQANAVPANARPAWLN